MNKITLAQERDAFLGAMSGDVDLAGVFGMARRNQGAFDAFYQYSEQQAGAALDAATAAADEKQDKKTQTIADVGTFAGQLLKSLFPGSQQTTTPAPAPSYELPPPAQPEKKSMLVPIVATGAILVGVVVVGTIVMNRRRAGA